MSEFHPKIETIDDWNAALGQCGCCEMPICLEPVLECQSQWLTLCAHIGPPDVYPDDGAPSKESDSDSLSEYCNTFWKTHKVGCKVLGSTTILGIEDTVQREISADYENWTFREYRNVWSPAAGPGTVNASTCQELWTCHIGGTYSDKTYGIWTMDGSTLVGPFISLDSQGELFNMAGQPDPTWSPGSDETSADAPILRGPCAPMWKWVVKYYEADYDSETGDLLGSILTSTEEYWSNASGCEFGLADDSSDSEPDWFTSYNEYGIKLDCASMVEEMAGLAETLWPTDNPSDSESLEGTDLDLMTASSCGAMFECRPCEIGRARRFRYRWTVPLCHPGSYYRIDWDEVFFPQAYLDWLDLAEMYDPNSGSGSDLPTGIGPFDPNANPPPVLPVMTPKTWTWMGEALGECVDFDSNLSDSSDPIANDLLRREAITTRISPWSNTVYVPAPGIVEVRNIRVRCYDNPFGSVPQPVADASVIYDSGDVDQDGVADSMEPLSDSTSV